MRQFRRLCMPLSPAQLFIRNVQIQRHTKTPELAHLEAQYEARPAIPYAEKQEALTVMQAANRRAELEGIAREIHAHHILVVFRLARKNCYILIAISLLSD